MWSPHTDIKFNILDHNDVAEAAQCIADTFAVGEPTTIALNVSAAEFLDYAAFLCAEAAAHGLSVVARDQRTNTFMGCALVEPAGLDKKINPLTERYLPVYELLKQASGSMPTINSAYLSILAVNRRYQGCGVAKKLLSLQSYFLMKHDYQYLYAECTNPYSLKALHDIFSCDPRYTKGVEYRSFKYEGRRPFEKLSGEVVTSFHILKTLRMNLAEWAAQQKMERNTHEDEIETDRVICTP